jgi:hypothetical protein
MFTVPPSLLASTGFQDLSTFRDAPQAARTRQIDTRTQVSADLTVVTVEGDRVTLAADSALQASYTSYDARGRVRGQSLNIHAEALAATAADRIAVTVEGNLNEQELADIQHLLSSIEGIATDFFAGAPAQELVQTLDLRDFSALASFNATWELTHQVRIEQLVSTTGGRRRPEILAAATLPTVQTTRLLDALTQTVQGVQAATGRFASQRPALLNQLLAILTAGPNSQADQHALASKHDSIRL